MQKQCIAVHFSRALVLTRTIRQLSESARAAYSAGIADLPSDYIRAGTAHKVMRDL